MISVKHLKATLRSLLLIRPIKRDNIVIIMYQIVICHEFNCFIIYFTFICNSKKAIKNAKNWIVITNIRNG